MIQFFLENRGKVFNQASLAKALRLSPSTVSRVIEPLVSVNILVYEKYDNKMKLIALNEEDEKTKLLSDFYEKLKAL